MTKGRNKWWSWSWWSLLLLQKSQAAVPVITYKVPDGVTGDSYIGNIGQDGQFRASFAERQFQIVKGSELLKIDPRSGDLRTAVTIDRESVCDREVEKCVFNAEIITTPQSMFKLFKVELEVEDLNDNAPVFPSPKIEVSLSEEAQLGHLLRLDSATDADTLKYGIKKYSIKDGQGYFGLEQQKLSDGSIVPMVKLLRPLDHERQTQHTFTLLAHDGGTPSLTGEVKVTVNVLDVNDHSPVFDAPEYTISLLETVKRNTQIFTFSATDEDSGQFGTVRYRYGSLVSAKTAELFDLDQDTGIVTVKGSLDYETKKTHNLYVEADDGGHIAYTTLTINVVDVNDNEPVIDVSFIDNQQGEYTIMENIEIGSFVAFVSVTDRDNRNEQLKTELLDPQNGFELHTVDADSNRFILRTKSELDRERVSFYELTILATDSGHPPKRTAKKIELSVGDQNDNAPYFGQPQYHMGISEGNTVGSVLTRLEAADLDTGDNAKLTYHLVSLRADGELADPSGIFAVDLETGDVTVLRSFDAESDPAEFSLEVEARDGGSPSLGGTCQLMIKVLNINDNAPVFERDKYLFSVDENNEKNFAVGQVRAQDADRQDSITYSFEKAPSIFYLEPRTGVIFLAEHLDYESDPHHYEYKVIADDGNGRQGHVNVEISLANLNDNAPELTWPNAQSDIIHLDVNKRYKVGEVVAKLQASDTDRDNVITFSIDRADTDLVSINELTGELRLTRNIERNDFGSHLIVLRLEDDGTPTLSTEAKVNIYVSDKDRLGEEEFALLLAEFQIAQVQEVSFNNLAVLLMSLFLVLLILMLVITASLFIRHRSQRKEVYRCRDRTSRYEPKPRHHLSSPKQPTATIATHASPTGISRHSRDEIAWPIETLESWNKQQEETTSVANIEFGIIENSFHSTVDSGRDSGSARFSSSGSSSEYKETKPKPTFSTFVDDESDRESMLMHDETPKKQAVSFKQRCSPHLVT